MEPNPVSFNLTYRMVEVAECLINGMIEKEVAEKLFISVSTVSYHKQNLFLLFQVRSVSQLLKQLLVQELIVNDGGWLKVRSTNQPGSRIEN